MIGVAVVASMLAVGRRYVHCSGRAVYYAELVRERRMTASVPGMTDWAYANQRRNAADFDTMRVRYERAAYQFWEPLPAEAERNR